MFYRSTNAWEMVMSKGEAAAVEMYAEVTDWSISADGPAWMTDVLEKYDPDAILEPTVLHRGKAQFFLSAKISTLVETRTTALEAKLRLIMMRQD